jgi:hypothetical protein
MKTSTSTSTSTSMAKSVLEECIRSNNEGLRFLLAGDKCREATRCFHQAMQDLLSLTHGLAPSIATCSDSTADHSLDDLKDLSYFSGEIKIKIPVETDTDESQSAFYVFRRGIVLEEEELVSLWDLDPSQDILRFVMVCTLWNAALSAWQWTHLQKSLQFYSQVHMLSSQWTFLTLAALNNLSGVLLQMGSSQAVLLQAQKAQADLIAFNHNLKTYPYTVLAPQEQHWAQEFVLNTTLLSITRYFSALPARAA